MASSNSDAGTKGNARSKESSVTYLGHASLLIETGGVRILTDPILRNRILFLQRTTPSIDRADYQDIKAVLISHLHYDHLDIRSLRMLENSYQLVVPHGTAPVLDKNGIERYQEVQIGEEIQIGAVSVKAIFADHTSSRHPLGATADCLGFVIRGDINIYFPGDTRFFPGMAALAVEDLDLALMPIWGWGYHRGRMHMGPKEAAQALELLRPKVAVPIHWGTFIPWGIRWLNPAFYYLPPIEFVRHANQIAPQVDVRVLKPGEKIIFNKKP